MRMILKKRIKCRISLQNGKMEEMEAYMADIIIITVLVVAVFFILRSQFGKRRKGQCGGGCSGCAGCSGCQSCGCGVGTSGEKKEG